MSDADRTAARELISYSLDRNGNVDLKQLKANQYRWANEQKEHELENSKNAGDIAGRIRNYYVKDIDRATKEVLGLIPESQWHYSDTTMTNMLRGVVEAFKTDHPTEYACAIPRGHEFDASKPLSVQGIQCHTRDGKGRN